MRRLRRVTAFLLSFLLAHVMWVGSGFACALPVDRPDGAMAAVTHEMDMTQSGMRGMNMSPTVPGQPDEVPKDDHSACDLPWAPAGCQSTSPCAPLADVVTASLLEATERLSSSILPGAELKPPSAVRIPELPPPRS